MNIETKITMDERELRHLTIQIKNIIHNNDETQAIVSLKHFVEKLIDEAYLTGRKGE